MAVGWCERKVYNGAAVAAIPNIQQVCMMSSDESEYWRHAEKERERKRGREREREREREGGREGGRETERERERERIGRASKD